MKKQPFTMIEMIVVVVIIATLAGIATPLYFNHVKTSRISTAKMQIAMFEQGVFNYRLEVRKLPETLNDLIKNNHAEKKWKGPYIKGGLIPKDPWGNDYIYKRPGEHGEFDIISYGADGVPGGEDENADIGNWNVEE